MGKLTDLLREENADAEAAALAAAAGRSLTGLSGHHGNLADAPIAGERVAPLRTGGAPPAPAGGAPRTRVPFGEQQMTGRAPKRPGYFRYGFNDDRDRIERAKLAGYTHVLEADGSPVCWTSGRSESGQGLRTYLMEIPIEWYEKDKAAEDAVLEDKLAEIRHGRSGPGAGDNRYIPKQGITYRSGTTR